MRTICFVIGLLQSLTLIGQKYDYEPSQLKEVTINYIDSIAIVNVYTVEKEFKTKDNIRYYWYYSNKLHSNIGGYQGRLLHGNYLVLNSNNNLITKGYLKSGVKNGVWKHWYSNGVLKEIINYNEGIKEGIHLVYDETGKKIIEENYKNGVLHGECLYIKDHIVLNKRYKNGTPLQENRSDIHFNKLFKQKGPLVQDENKQEVAITKGGEETGVKKKERKVDRKGIEQENISDEITEEDSATYKSRKLKHKEIKSDKDKVEKEKKEVEIKEEPKEERIKIDAGKHSIKQNVKN